MTLEELKQLFRAELLSPSIRKPIRRQPAAPSKDTSYHYTFYPTHALNELTRELKTLDPDEPIHNRLTARYLVTKEQTLFFAREGQPGVHIPAHRSIRAESLAAGNIIFSEDHRFITGINHQSGDFHSTTGSMIWALAILFMMHTPLAESFTFTLSEMIHSDFVCTPLIVTREELASLLPEELIDIDLSANGHIGIERHDFEDPRYKKRKRTVIEENTLPSTNTSVSEDSGYFTP